MAKLLEGKCAVVTGSGRGIGREIALAMARQGAKVVVNDLGGEVDGTGAARGPADEVVTEIKKAGGTAVANYDSVADFAAAEKIINTCVQSFGRIDILVNNAGIGGRRDLQFWEIDKEEWDKVIAVHLNGTFNTCRHALARMVKQRSGRIINISSPAWLGVTGPSAYTAAKGGIASLTMGIAQQMALEGYGVTCNAIAPIADTRMSPRRAPERFERWYKAGLITRQIYQESTDPPGPEHVAPVAVYLATDQAACFNGQVLGASRGRVALYSWPTEAKGLYKEGLWTPEELVERIPTTLAQDVRSAKG